MDRSCIGDELRSQVNYLRQLMKDFKIPLTFSMLTDPKLAIGYSAPRSQGLRKQMTTVTAAAQAAMANKTEELYKQMLAMQMNSNEQVLKAKEGSEQTQLEIMKAALAAAQDSNSKVIKAHEKSTENAERWNEKSIDAMSKVATAVANKSGKGDSKSHYENPSQIDCPECSAQIDKNSKFCGVCGFKLSA
jgi:hypothetical protein